MFGSIFNGGMRLRAARAVVERLAPLLDLRFCVRLWDGSIVPLGEGANPDWCIAISGPGVISSLLRRPTLDNLIQQYVAGRIDFRGTDLFSFWEMARRRRSKVRLGELGLGWLARKVAPFLFFPADSSSVVHAADHEGRRTATSTYAKEVRFHYDVSNGFYQLFLDPEMIYTCAYFTDWGNSLAQAQLDKLDMICRKLRLCPGDTFLDIGCGWGGLVCYAARHYGVKAHGITLSMEQLAYAQERIRGLGLQDRVSVEYVDYINVEGRYDKIASVGMMEQVGIAHYGAYFGKLSSLLRDRGLLLNHAIARRAKVSKARFRRLRPEQRTCRSTSSPAASSTTSATRSRPWRRRASRSTTSRTGGRTTPSHARCRRSGWRRGRRRRSRWWGRRCTACGWRTWRRCRSPSRMGRRTCFRCWPASTRRGGCRACRRRADLYARPLPSAEAFTSAARKLAG